MRTVSIFKNRNNRAIRLPRDLDFEGGSELEIVRERDSIILCEQLEALLRRLEQALAEAAPA